MERDPLCVHSCFLHTPVTGQEIRLLRKRAGIPQTVLARRIGYSTRHIRNIEKGKRRLTLSAQYAIMQVIRSSTI
jgi:DNA-binding transcriptional regulator YiaG